MAMTLHKKKYQNLILYLCKKLGGEIRGKKKLAKLLYFVDFDFYEKYQESITGDIYKAFPMGPLPTNMGKITEEMVQNDLVSIESIEGKDGYNPTEIYRCLSEPDISVFSENEKKMIDRVADKYGRLNGKELEELSHAEAPYVATELREDIAYELSFYRGTEFIDL